MKIIAGILVGVLDGVLVIGIVSVVWYILARITMWAWNSFAVAAFGAPPITFWTAVAGMILLSIVGGMFSRRG